MNNEIQPIIDHIKDQRTRYHDIPHSGRFSAVYNLAPGARLLNPCITPLRNAVPRSALSPERFVRKDGEDIKIPHYMMTRWNGPLLYFEQPIMWMKQRNSTCLEAQYYGHGQVDAKALADANALRAFMIAEEKLLWLASSTYKVYDHQEPVGPCMGNLSRKPLWRDRLAWNGLLAQLSMKGSGAVILRDKKGERPLSCQLESLLTTMAAKNRVVPDIIYVAADIAASLDAEYDSDGYGYRVSTFNDIPLHTVRDLPKGHAVAIHTDPLPSVLSSEIPGPYSMALMLDYQLVDYAPWTTCLESELMVAGTFRVHMPFCFGWIHVSS